MNIVVCIKQVPETTEVRINPETNTLIREGVKSIINPFDMYAIEEGLRLKDKLGGKVTVITMGPPQAEAALKEALSLGANEAILLCDRAFAGSDTWATSYTLAGAIKKIKDYGGVPKDLRKLLKDAVKRVRSDGMDILENEMRRFLPRHVLNNYKDSFDNHFLGNQTHLRPYEGHKNRGT